MQYVKTCKAIRMTVDTENFLDNALTVLQSIHKELGMIAKEDDYFEGLADDCCSVCEYLEEFIDSFKDYARGEDN